MYDASTCEDRPNVGVCMEIRKEREWYVKERASRSVILHPAHKNTEHKAGQEDRQSTIKHIAVLKVAPTNKKGRGREDDMRKI